MKQFIADFYRKFFNEHDVQSAAKYISENYIQHNPGVKQGRAALMEAFAERFEIDPEFHVEIQRMILEDDFAAVYLKNINAKGETRVRIVDIYRIENGKLAEHWDVLQQVQE